nr:hypothetical protein [Tanacetum cinerariifolium]
MYYGEYPGNQHDPHLQMLLKQQKNPSDNIDPDEQFYVVSQPPVFTKKDVNSDSNGLSSTGLDNTRTRRL